MALNCHWKLCNTLSLGHSRRQKLSKKKNCHKNVIDKTLALSSAVLCVILLFLFWIFVVPPIIRPRSFFTLWERYGARTYRGRLQNQKGSQCYFKIYGFRKCWVWNFRCILQRDTLGIYVRSNSFEFAYVFKDCLSRSSSVCIPFWIVFISYLTFYRQTE